MRWLSKLWSGVLNVVMDPVWDKHHQMEAHNGTTAEMLWRYPKDSVENFRRSNSAFWVVMHRGKLYRATWPDSVTTPEQAMALFPK